MTYEPIQLFTIIKANNSYILANARDKQVLIQTPSKESLLNVLEMSLDTYDVTETNEDQCNFRFIES